MKDRKTRIEAFINQKSYHPLLFDELAVVLDVPSEDSELFRCVLEELEAEGRIIKTRRNRYASPKKMGVVAGSFQGHERGFGFVVPDADDEDDLFIGSENINGAMHGDRVLARITKHSYGEKSAEGEIIKILSRANEKIVGLFDRSGSFGFVTPDHRKIKGDIFIPIDETMGAKLN